MSRKKIEITREWLETLGITNVTEDGRVFKGEKELSKVKIKAPHKYGKDLRYEATIFYDPQVYVEQKAKGKHRGTYPLGQRCLLTHRIVYAWFNGKAPSEGDICHKDDNPLNNHKDNLIWQSHEKNIKDRGIGRNQFTYMYTEEQLRNRNANLKYYDAMVKDARDTLEQIRVDIENNQESTKKAFEELRELKEKKKEIIREWKFWVSARKDFLKDWKEKNK